MLAGTLLFAMLALYVHGHPVLALDLEITRWLQSFRNPGLDLFMLFIGIPHFYPQVIPLNIAVILILFIFRLKWEALTMTIVGALVGITSTLLRYGIDRPRPTPNLVWVAQEIEKGHYGFPSGHTFGGIAIFGFIGFVGFLLLRPSAMRTVLVWTYAIYILLIGISRIYAGEHWASDVLGGYLGGSVFLALMILFYDWGREHVLPHLARWMPALRKEQPVLE